MYLIIHISLEDFDDSETRGVLTQALHFLSVTACPSRTPTMTWVLKHQCCWRFEFQLVANLMGNNIQAGHCSWEQQENDSLHCRGIRPVLAFLFGARTLLDSARCKCRRGPMGDGICLFINRVSIDWAWRVRKHGTRRNWLCSSFADWVLGV